ncbi:MAG TPA: hypothetical protein VMT55_02220 [Candidatus Sulfotelmatobacter sp.]|nr:hypothetical protein [Candidatus Sulfotelmatobacter sp.]
MMTEDIRDIKGVIGVWDWGTLLFFILLLLLILALTYFAWRYYLKRKARAAGQQPSVKEPEKPFNVLAEEAIAALDPLKYFDRGEFKQYYIILTEIVRQFLAKNYLIDTYDKTSYEIIEQLEKAERDFEKIKIADAYFQAGDLVKFAKQRPDLAEMKEAKARSLRIVKEFHRHALR